MVDVSPLSSPERSAVAARRRLPPGVRRGVLRPALPLSTTWQTARETGALADLPHGVGLAVAPVYEAQARHRELGDALTRATLADVQRRGAEPVLRDDFARFIPLERDVANREQVLAAAYARTIARVDSMHRATGGR